MKLFFHLDFNLKYKPGAQARGRPITPARAAGLYFHQASRTPCGTLRALAMGVGSLANETGDSYALRASERATRLNNL